MKTYNNESIKSLKGPDRVRKRPGVIFGSDGIEGCKHSVFEILSNSIDEAREGHGKTITVILHPDDSITVEDEGRGIPVGYNRKEKRYNWELIFTELYAGGKYNTNEGVNYQYSLGLNGLGLCATQYSSEYMDVEIHHGGEGYQLHFEKGHNVGGLKKKKGTFKTTGTKITWRPDLDVFTEIHMEDEFFETMLKEQAVVNQGVKFRFVNERSGETKQFFYQYGIRDYIDELALGKNLTDVFEIKAEGKGRDRKDMPQYRVKFDLVFALNNEVNELKYFHNSSALVHGGSPDLAVKTAFMYEIDKFLKQHNKYKKDEGMINFVDIQDSLLLILNSFSTVTSYENQTKKSITNNFIREFLTDSIREHLEVIFTENPTIMHKILDQVLVNKRSREKADATRTAMKRKLSQRFDVTNKVANFIDCRSKDPSKRELFIVEGQSALGAVMQARDANFQALFPIRGKILNTLKSDVTRIVKNEIIMDLMKVLGCGVSLKGKAQSMSSFDIDNLRFDKIIIATDADVDGFQIRTLVLTMFYTIAPELLREGKVYIVESPLYEIVTKERSLFAFNDTEKNQILKDLGDQKSIVHRSKGLGENEPQMMALTTMNPDTRKLIKVQFEDTELTRYTFDALLGDNIVERKKIIELKGADYLPFLDLS
ncbi:MAG: DNA topoisomerase [Tissierellia bacterium]|nr:DNA topoisomerase [Tissierellia bacterium]